MVIFSICIAPPPSPLVNAGPGPLPLAGDLKIQQQKQMSKL